MELLQLDDSGPTTAPTLVVMLPGAYSAPREFVEEGFVDALRELKAPIDVVIAGAKVEHYIEGKVLERLHDEVIAPARQRGTRSVWLVGISLGGLFALSYAVRRSAELSGVLVLAPYLGRRTLLAEIEAAGGPHAWARRTPRDDDLLEHAFWMALPAQAALAERIHLGYGRQDRFAEAHQVLERQLPPERSFSIDGGHDWPVWRALWRRWLSRGWIGS